jgi:undecaprenyl-diphosphatase
LLLGDFIKAYLFGSIPVALALIVGAFVILAVERFYKSWRIDSVDEMTWRDAFLVGVAQCFALFPGVSRAGATIIGGMLCGLSRKASTEFSFFLAVPTLVAAGAYDFYKQRAAFSGADLEMLAVGLVAAFVSAFVCVRWLIRYVATHDFKPFAWYRIAFGVIVLFTAYTGLVNWTVG